MLAGVQRFWLWPPAAPESKRAMFENTVDGEFQQIAARRASVTTYSGNTTTSFSGTMGRVGEIRPVTVEGDSRSRSEGTSFSEGAAMAAQRQAALDNAAK